MDEQRRQALQRVWQRGLLVSCLGGAALLSGCPGGVDTIIDTDPPQITRQPTAQTTTVGGSATFSVSATGSAPLVYQWQYATNPNSTSWTDVSSGGSTYTVSGATAGMNGRYYRVAVANYIGTAFSNAALLTVNP